jgi:7,8-dihydropterin-6-yl-methyl-4-(beta-D-ribofuranosyl)aminobenzene 5'-phosphate synthase
MNDSLRITVLVENSVHRVGLAAEHGLSFHLQFRGQNVMFDAGQTSLVIRNARELGISLANLKAMVLSHGHYDHTGGVPAVLASAKKGTVFAHPAGLAPKYSCPPGEPARFIGISEQTSQALRGHPVGLSETCGWAAVADGIFATGEIPRVTAYEGTGGPFYLDAEARHPDPIVDDQALVVDLGRGLVVLLGCAHSGVVNTLDHIAAHTRNKPVRAIIGGMHLGGASGERIEKTIDRLHQAAPDILMPLHCTGWPAMGTLWEAFPKAFRPGGVGAVLEVPPY